ncbi:hypothetical protein [Desulfurobacterium crinifex]
MDLTQTILELKENTSELLQRWTTQSDKWNQQVNDLVNYGKSKIDGFIAGAEATIKSWWAPIFYVNQQTGSDNNEGSESSPFQSLKKAIDSVPVGGYGIVVLQDNYTLQENIDVRNKTISVVGTYSSDQDDFKELFASAYETWTGKASVHGFHLYGSATIGFRGLKITLGHIDNKNVENYSGDAGFIKLGTGSIPITAGINFNRCAIHYTGTCNGNIIPILAIPYWDTGTFAHLNFYASSITLPVSSGSFIRVHGILGLTVKGTSLKDESSNDLEWKGVIAGIIEDTNGRPINIISTTVL